MVKKDVVHRGIVKECLGTLLELFLADFFWVFLSKEVKGRFGSVKYDLYLWNHCDFTLLYSKLISSIVSTVERRAAFFILFIRTIKVNKDRPSINFENRARLSYQSDRLVNIKRRESEHLTGQLNNIIPCCVENLLLEPCT